MIAPDDHGDAERAREQRAHERRDTAARHRKTLVRAALHEAHARHLRAGTFDAACPHCVVERELYP
jgi:hypothetical protein